MQLELVIRGALVLAVLASGCALDRSGLGGNLGFDGAVEMRDAQVAPEDSGHDMDARVDLDSGLDAGAPSCAVPCTDGRECVGTTCVCPPGACCPGCPAFQICSGGACVSPPCGAIGQACCDTGSPCATGAACEDGTCLGCGGIGQPCCAGTCTSGACEAGLCVETACGAIGQPCCSGNTCRPDAACPWAVTRTCVACGGSGEPCCAGSRCDSADVACEGVTSTCRPCGGRLEVCCTEGAACGPGRSCVLGVCS